jgi:hypothetical protein
VPIALIAWHFPYASDDPVRREDAVREFYELSYSGSRAVVRKDSELTRQAAMAAVRYNIRGRVERFATCLNCLPGGWRYLQREGPLVIRVNKDGPARRTRPT